MGLTHINNLARKLQFTLRLPRRPSDLISQILNSPRILALSTVKQLLQRHKNLTQLFISPEGLLVLDLENQILPSGIRGGFIDGESHGVIPNRVGPSVLMNGRLLLGVGIVGEVNDDVWIHLSNEIDVLEIFG
uniref:Uncharacterized protein n=1 Tax=Opuntia streptacantha TaxID=393608 RepID=A0A7C8ZFL1_OPUST